MLQTCQVIVNETTIVGESAEIIIRSILLIELIMQLRRPKKKRQMFEIHMFNTIEKNRLFMLYFKNCFKRSLWLIYKLSCFISLLGKQVRIKRLKKKIAVGGKRPKSML